MTALLNLRINAAPVLGAFFILYNISFIFNESFSTARLAVIFFMLAILVKRPNVLPFDSRLLILFFPVPYIIAQYFLSGDSVQLSRFFHLALYSYLGAYLIAAYAGDVDRLLHALLLAISIQSMLLLYSFFSPSYRAWVDGLVALSANFGVENIYRAPGFTSSAGSSLSIIQSLGVLVGGIILWRADRLGRKKSTAVMLSMLLCAASCIFVGRTGLILSFIFIVTFCASSGSWQKMGFLLLATLAPLGLYVGSRLEEFLPSGFSKDFFLEWAFGFLRGENLSVSDLSSMPIPPLTIDTFLGTGLVGLIEGVNPSGNDSGFVQGYYSMGVVFAVGFYGAYLMVMCWSLRWLPLLLRLCVIFLMMAIEIKEPFVFKYATLFVLLSISFVMYTSGDVKRPTIPVS